MFNSPVDEIKSRLDIVEVIGSYLKLQKAGANYRALCPFHSEKSPSFFVSPARQIWHCFGSCGIGGDIFKFVMQIEGVEFGDALRILAKKAGVELRQQSSDYKKWQTERQRLFEICELACRFFEKQMEESKIGKSAKEYLISRGIKKESIKKWRLGYAPDVWQGLADFLRSKDYSQKEIEKAGLGLSSEKGSFYDRFRGRIIFPIFDLNSQIAGFGGRIFKDKDKKEIAKYINTPQTALYDKSRILYGLDKAKIEIKKNDFCILVEGFTDVIMASQAGFENVVATSGTALTTFQLKILKRYSENLLTAFDMDVAGDAATKRGIDLAQSYGFNIKVITLPEGLVPADLILKDSKEWEERTKKAKSIMDFYFESVFAKFDKETAGGKKEIARTLLPIIKKNTNRIVQSHWVSELSKRLRIKEEIIEEELKKTKTEEHSNFYKPEKEHLFSLPSKPRRELLEERLVVLFLKFPQKVDFLKEEDFKNFSGPIKEILESLKKKEKIDSNDFNRLALMADIEEIEEKEVIPEIECCLKEIRFMDLKEKLDEISQEIKEVEQEKKWEKVEELTKKFNKLAKQKCQN